MRSIDAILADGATARFGEVPANIGDGATGRYRELIEAARRIGAREADEIERRFPKLLRRVGGYNLDTIDPAGHNMARLLVGSEGTLAAFDHIELDLQPIPPHRVLGICHFERFYDAMAVTQHIVTLEPTAVELVDRTLLDLAGDIELFRPTLERFVRGRPEALLLVEFAGEEQEPLLDRLQSLDALLGDHGFPDSLVRIVDAREQKSVWDVRKAGLNIVMSMRGDAKPVSFVEDCAVKLSDLAEYTRRLTDIFEAHGTRGTWYAHASVGTLHVRPILNLKEPRGAATMRLIAEACFEMVREYEGSHSGEHGDGIVRSEFHEPMFGSRLVRAFEELKDEFDPGNVLNPGKIVFPERMDDRSLLRYPPGYRTIAVSEKLDWSEHGSLAAAAEACNNNGACRKFDAEVMCPSFRVTRDERHLTRGRANTLRLALSGQLGEDAFASDELRASFDLCVGCKGCRRECPTGVDVAKMKTEFLAQYHERHARTPRQRLFATLPRWAPWAARLAPAFNLRDKMPGLAQLSERLLGFAAARPLPRLTRGYPADPPPVRVDTVDVVIFADTFKPLVRTRSRDLGPAGAGSGRAASGRRRGARRRTPAVLRAYVPRRRHDRRGTRRSRPDPRRARTVSRARHADHWPRAVLHVHAPRRSGLALRREDRRRRAVEPVDAIVRILSDGNRCAAARDPRPGARTRSLPPEEPRRLRLDARGARPGPRPRRPGRSRGMLRNGRRLRLRGGTLRHLARHRRKRRRARRSRRRRRRRDRRDRHQLPAPDRRRDGARGDPSRDVSRAGARVSDGEFREAPLATAIGMVAVPGKPDTLCVPYSQDLVGDPDTGVVHGGVITALLDSASGAATRRAVEDRGPTSIATLDLRIDYMRPATPRQTIFATAECYRTTRHVAFVRAWAYQADEDDLVATSVGTFMLGTFVPETPGGSDR